MFDSVSSDAQQDAYYEAIMTNNTKLHGAMEIQRQTIQALLETVKQMLNYLQNKNRKNRVDPEIFLAYVKDTAIETGETVDFATLWNQMSQHG